MKVVIAIDSLKGSLTSMEAGSAIQAGVRRVVPDCEIVIKPLADGGEGTTAALTEGLQGELVQTEVSGPMGNRIKAEYGILPENRMAVMEMAAAAGITLTGKEKQPLGATTYGVGEMILDAVRRGCRSFVIGIGGSATNDGGLGMLSALGYEFLDKNGKITGITASSLSEVTKISDQKVPDVLSECTFKIACDVTNPLCGEHGATYIYGPQKGVTEEMKQELDQNMAAFAAVAAEYAGVNYIDTPGVGAAGGLGFAFLTFLNATLQPGIELVMEAVELQEAVEGAALVFTGEGRMDEQTAMGKAPAGVAKLAKQQGAVVVGLAGSIGSGAEKCNEKNIDAYFPILQSAITLEEAMSPETARENMTRTAEQVMRLYLAAGRKISR